MSFRLQKYLRLHIFLIQAIDTQHDDTLIIKLKKLFLFVIFSGATLGNVCL